MRRVERPEDLPAALASGSAEAASAFGDGRVYVEREIRPARHVEVQLLGDATGAVIAVGSGTARCSAGTRSSSRNRPRPACRQRSVGTSRACVRIGQAARLTNAATAEFLLDEQQSPAIEAVFAS